MNLMKTLTLKNLKLNRKRTIVTIVGIILATALLSALVTLVSSFQYSMIEYQKQKDGDFHVKFSNVKMSELSEFKNNRNIESTFETMGMGFAKLDGCKNEDKPYAYVMATDEAGFERGCFKLIEGRMAKNEDEIVIPRHLKTNGRIDIKVGDEITLDVGKRYDSNTESGISENCAYEHEAETLTDTVTKHYKVVGIMERPGYGMEDYSAAGYTFVTYSDELAAIDNGTKSEASEGDTTLTVYSRYTQKALRNKDAVTADIIGVDEKLFAKANNSSVEMTAEESDRFLKEMENAKYDIYMNGFLISYECVFPIDGSFKTLFTVAAVVALIIILTSVYCIKNSFNISITEKIRQYGMLASVGATRRQIKSSVKTEAAMLGVVGIPVGTMSGILASLVLVKVVNTLSAGWLNFALSFHTSLPALILAVIMSIATIYFSATGSARKAAKVTPLTSLSINLENLEGNPDMASENRSRIMRRAKRDVDNISHMVQSILKLSRLEADVVEFDEKDTLLSEIVSEAADNVMALCDLRDIRLSIDEGSDKDACIHADAYWQCEAITNIVKNAVEHAESEVKIGFYRYEMYAEITVQNDGEAINDEDKKHIFTRFYSGSGQPADSIGIGLSLAEAIVRHDNGYILVEDCTKDVLNEKNECSGTRFVVRYL